MGLRAHLNPAWRGWVNDKSGVAIDRVSAAVAFDAQRFAPVDTGALRDGIEAEPAEGGTGRVSVKRQGLPGDDPDVPIHVEFGTANMTAQPYMRPALYRRRNL